MGKDLVRVQKAAFVVLAVLMVIMLCELAVRPNVDVWQGRATQEITPVAGVERTEVVDSAAPAGALVVYRFALGEEISGGTCLAFELHHQYADVTIDGEVVYSLRPADGIEAVTLGCNWVMVPLEQSDVGREVLVLVTPMYGDWRATKDVDFWLGSALDIYKAELKASITELVLSLVTVLMGLILLVLALYCLVQRVGGGEIFALGMLAVVMGLWRLSYADFASLVLQTRPVFVYYLSLAALMLCPILLMKSVKTEEKGRRLLDVACVVVAIIDLGQVALQLAGIVDMREVLKLTHATIVVAVLMIFGVTLREMRHRGSMVWLIGLGMLLDLVFYYTGVGLTGLVFTLFFLLCYVVVEGVRICMLYFDQARLLAEKEAQLAQSRFTTMMSQIRSHFIFNILNAISGMCKYDPQKADETIVCFARYLRSNIDIMQDDQAVTFHSDLRHLEDYIELEQVRFGDRIQFETDIKVETFMLPPLILQPLVENAIKHGLNPKAGGGTVKLRTWETEDEICVAVEDDGVGFDVTAGVSAKSVGLQNVRFRLEHLMHGRLEMTSEVGRGTVATVIIPKKEAEKCG